MTKTILVFLRTRCIWLQNIVDNYGNLLCYCTESGYYQCFCEWGSCDIRSMNGTVCQGYCWTFILLISLFDVTLSSLMYRLSRIWYLLIYLFVLFVNRICWNIDCYCHILLIVFFYWFVFSFDLYGLLSIMLCELKNFKKCIRFSVNNYQWHFIWHSMY